MPSTFSSSSTTTSMNSRHELSKRLKLHKNNVFRLLATLESRG